MYLDCHQVQAHLLVEYGVWMLVSFIEQRGRVGEKVKLPLSCRVATGISWSPLRGVKGVKPPMEFGEMTRDCFPGHAGKKALISR